MITIEQTLEHRKFVHAGVRLLAADDPDFAAKRNGIGFNASDAHYGHVLARLDTDKLSVTHIIDCNNLCIKYQKQLPPDYWTLDIMDGDTSPELQLKRLPQHDDLSGARTKAKMLEASVASVMPTPTAAITMPTPTSNSPVVPLSSSLTLTEEQEHAVDLVMTFLDDLRPEVKMFKLGGFAGTGKTTVSKVIRQRALEQHSMHSEVTAFTGKACAVLRRKGVHAITSHSLMYRAEETKEGWKFWKRDILETRPDFIIVDEASMYSTELYNDLMSFGLKVVFIGDPGQLEPVGDNPDLMRKPDFVLSKIHRQAAESPIIQFAHHVRNGGAPMNQTRDGLVVKPKTFSTADLLACDQVICAKNKTRTHWNDRIRLNSPGFTGEKIRIGEKLIVLRNNTAFYVFNGLILTVTEVAREETVKQKYGPPKFKCWIVHAKDEIGKEYRNLPIWQDPFTRTLDKNEYPPKEVVYADYGYVVTCHKSQGSEWDKVLVIDEWMPPQVWDMKRWRYTAITRAAKDLTYCV